MLFCKDIPPPPIIFPDLFLPFISPLPSPIKTHHDQFPSPPNHSPLINYPPPIGGNERRVLMMGRNNWGGNDRGKNWEGDDWGRVIGGEIVGGGGGGGNERKKIIRMNDRGRK